MTANIAVWTWEKPAEVEVRYDAGEVYLVSFMEGGGSEDEMQRLSEEGMAAEEELYFLFYCKQE
jgi:hypothetical protein